MAYHLEKLSSDILDEDFANIFKPIHLLQAIVGNLNVKIKHGFVTPPSKWYNLWGEMKDNQQRDKEICFILGEIKRNAKRMLLLLDVKNDISLYDIYTLNARLLVRTLGVVTTYTVIILQFYV
ncbi:uncharacterized protein LOC135193870 [Vanessa tameamea]|uniref:Uncharacterized protein LOC135193870 n=1 Tax=Vanessa tameamea TaxID=334116 RepID=A0ABM4ASB7_VANTA